MRIRPADWEKFDEVSIRKVSFVRESGAIKAAWNWRSEVLLELKNKGMVMEIHRFPDMTTAVAATSYLHSFSTTKQPDRVASLCDQVGCQEMAVVTLRLKQQYKKCCQGEMQTPEYWIPVRRFCKKHKDRGNKGVEDVESNYEELAEETQSDEENE